MAAPLAMSWRALILPDFARRAGVVIFAAAAAALALHAALTPLRPIATADLPRSAAPPEALRLFATGALIETVEDWFERRRPELADLFEEHVYGALPEPPRFEVIARRALDPAPIAGAGAVEEVRLAFGWGDEAGMTALIVTPPGSGPHPVIIVANICGNQSISAHPDVTPTTEWARPVCLSHGVPRRDVALNGPPLEALLARGYALATFHESELAPDNPGENAGLRAWLASDDTPWAKAGALAAWAWGLRRVADLVESDPRLDDARIAVVGHSRRAKAALLAAALDDRIAVVIAHQAGAGGTSLSRSRRGETLGLMTWRYPHWFSESFARFAGREARLPVDQHLLIAMVAPRSVLVSNARGDFWADPPSSWRAVRLAGEVYEWLGFDGLDQDRPGAVNLDAPLAYRLRSGGHAMTGRDWEVFMDYLDAQLAAPAAAQPRARPARTDQPSPSPSLALRPVVRSAMRADLPRRPRR